MNTKVKQIPETNLNPVLNISIDGTVLYSNEASEPILNKWGVRIGEKLPSFIGDIVQRVISLNNPEKMEVKSENKAYLVVFHPLPEHDCVNISGFDISDQKNLEERIQESEEKYRAIFENSIDAILLTTPDGTIQEANPAACQMFMMSEEEIIQAGRDGTADISDPRFRSFLEKRARVGKSTGEHNHRRKDGTIFPGEVSSGFFKDKNGIIRTATIIRDISERKRAEEALRESEEKFRGLVEHVNDWVWEIDADGVYTYASPQARDLLGYEPADLLGTTPFNYMASEEADRVRSLFYSTLNAREEFSLLENTLIRKDGCTVTVETSGMPIYDSQGNFSGYRGIDRDISERKRAEEALKNAYDCLEERVKERTTELEITYKSLIESEKGLDEAQKMAHIGNWVWDIATDKTYWSNELYRIFGRSPQELAPTYNELLNYIHPDDRHHVDNATNKALNEKSSLSIDFRIILAGGEERRVHMQSEIIFDEKNIPIRIKGIVQDITERKKAEEKIHNLANIVESSEDAIGTLTLDGTITSWNKGAEKVYGYSVEEILGKCVSILAPSHLDKETIKLIEKIKQGEKVNNYDTLRLRKDEKTINVSITLSPVFDTSGKLTTVSFITRDTTKRIEAEEALAKIEIARKQEIHHRIKNNLQVISSLLDLQAEKFNNMEDIKVSEVKKAFRESQDRVISMALIHEELHKGGETEKLNFYQYIVQLVDNLFLTYRLGNENIGLNMNIDEDIFFDMDTAVPLGILINEFVSNSLKHAFYGRDKGEIQIKLHREENEGCEIEDNKSTTFTLSVADNGVGIPEDFDIEDCNSLGLQLVTTLVEQLDGELELKRGNGTKFTIRFIVIENNNSISVSTTKQSV